MSPYLLDQFRGLDSTDIGVSYHIRQKFTSYSTEMTLDTQEENFTQKSVNTSAFCQHNLKKISFILLT